jgi:CAAX prenyl protease-like protein
MNDDFADLPDEQATNRSTSDVGPTGDDLASDTTGEVTSKTPREPRPRVFGRFAFWIVVFPFIFYLVGMMAGGYIEKLRIMDLKGELKHAHEEEEANRPPEEEVDVAELERNVDPNARFLFGLLPMAKNSYPYTYTFVIAGTTVLMLLFGWGYFRAPLRISALSVVVGVVGIAIWVGLSILDRQYIGLGEKLSSGRTAFNPFEVLKDDPRWMWQFLAIRFFGLVVVVPIVEEFFIRGFLIRYVDAPDWDELPLGQAKPAGWLSPTVYGVVAHPMDPLSALAWFSLVSWLYKKTGSIWDCVVAHAVTNLLLGLYVVKYGQWYLW